jgi:hypothetical protein
MRQRFELPDLETTEEPVLAFVLVEAVLVAGSMARPPEEIRLQLVRLVFPNLGLLAVLVLPAVH